MNSMKQIVNLIFASFIGAGIAFFVQNQIFEASEVSSKTISPPRNLYSQPVSNSFYAAETTDFTAAAEKTIHGVVHVKNTSVQQYSDPFSSYFYGGRGQKEYSQVGTGSGVIISSDGYIITNNHVIKDASQIEITLNDKRTFEAQLIGADTNSDIALLKIDAEDLSYIPFANSDQVKIGEWVLAVGNPYNLTSTVTAGIISAKGRDLQGNFSTDSFIQTDAAVNPGNSGGALVNSRGELIGINTAISSQTGSFIGYSFAVPSNIAQKIVTDFMEFGSVQKVLLGIRPELDPDDKINGVGVQEVTQYGNAGKAGVKSGDIIVEMDGVKISNFSNLKGYLKSKRPGDVVKVKVDRNGEFLEKSVKLIKDDTVILRQLGMVVKDLDSKKAKQLGIDYGVEIQDLANEYLSSYGVDKGFVIVKINEKEINSVSDLQNALSSRSRKRAIFMEMYDNDGALQKYIFK